MKQRTSDFKEYVLAILIFILIGGCAASQKNLSSRHEMLIVSFPSGAVIDIDGQYIGKAPIVFDPIAYQKGKEDGLKRILISAHPAQEGYCRQAQYIDLSSAPEVLKFDMSLCP